MYKYNVTDSVWYTLEEECTIGIVTVVNEVGEVKKYIGRGIGLDQKMDEQFIAAHGVPFYGG